MHSEDRQKCVLVSFMDRRVGDGSRVKGGFHTSSLTFQIGETANECYKKKFEINCLLTDFTSFNCSHCLAADEGLHPGHAAETVPVR